MEPQKNRNPHYLEIRIPGIQASNNLGNLGWVPTLGELGYVHTLGELGCAHTLGELGYVHALGWESLAAVTLENYEQNYKSSANNTTQPRY